ncbi:MAG: DUF362 domain-containing protein [Candidatus Latescibacteria bacterium]|nr:DUF362 domain-containing protein [Candidatus Latescibacterota bacterium]
MLWLGVGALAPLSGTEFAVGLVASDDEALARPIGRQQPLDQAAVLDMLRRAVDLIGGMAAVVPDSASLVVIKPHIVLAMAPETGGVTDPRLVRAAALLVHEVAPGARILIAEGPEGWIAPDHPGAERAELSWLMRLFGRPRVDGFALGGYRAVVEELRGRGVDSACFDLNFDRAQRCYVPGGGWAGEHYDIAATVLAADAWINCPVAKTHGSKIAGALYNTLGVLPGRLYGWGKNRGTQEHPPIPYEPGLIDEVLVDLDQVAGANLNLVDGLVGREGGAFEQGRARRANWILAGRGGVATDLAVARLLGFNPADMEFAELARQHGGGPSNWDQVEVRGSAIEAVSQRFAKAGSAFDFWLWKSPWSQQANYGMGPRHWRLNGPHPLGHRAQVKLATEWSQRLFFGHDALDLTPHFGAAEKGVLYASCEFTMARSDSVRYWLGSDEALSVWIDGQLIYQHEGRRKHRLGAERLEGYIAAGSHRLLVRVEQTREDCLFSFNICEAVDEAAYAGNSHPGVRFSRPE